MEDAGVDLETDRTLPYDNSSLLSVPGFHVSVLFAQTSDQQAQDVIGRGLDLLVTPGGLAAVVVLIGMLAIGVMTDSGWRWILIALLFLATLVQGSTEFFNNSLFFPLEQLRSGSQLLNGLALCTIGLATLRGSPGTRWKIVSAIAIAMLCFELFYGVRLFLAGRALRGSLVLVAYLLLFSSISVGVGRRLQNDRNLESLIRSIGLVGIPYVLFNVLQYLYSPNQTVTNGRFAGISGNPQSAGLICSLLTVTMIWLLSRPRSQKWMLPVFGAAVGISALLLVWTGSRTAVLASMVGLAFMFRQRLGSIILLGGFVFGSGFIASLVLTDGADLLERVSSTENTRAEVWLVGLQEFLGSPIFGTLGTGRDEDLKVVESTPIQTLQVLGIIGFAFLAGIYGAIFLFMRRLMLIGRAMPSRRPLVDYVVGIWAMIGVMSLFEAVFLGVITFFTLMIYLVAAMSAYLVDPSGEARYHEELDEEEARAEAEEIEIFANEPERA